MRIVCISDTHGLHDTIEVPPCDLLLHSGDMSRSGSAHQITEFCQWFATRPAKYRVLIAGNHDFLFQKNSARAAEILAEFPIIYLQDSGTVIEDLHIWGSPWQPWFFDWAFNLRTEAELASVWAKIPESTNILLTHGPPYGIMDRVVDGRRVGCKALLERCLTLPDLRLHVFGHIHEGYGQVREGALHFVNAASVDVRYRPVNSPVVVEWSDV
jgi:predicted phosphodiesterase